MLLAREKLHQKITGFAKADLNAPDPPGLTILTEADLALNSLHFGKQNAKETLYVSNSANAVDTGEVHSIR